MHYGHESSRSLLSTVLQDKALREKAEDELHETAESRGEESRDLISWIEKGEEKVPKLTDSCYLWSFLRTSKFRQDATRQRMRNYWYSRRKAIMQVMNDIDPASPDILNILKGPNAVYIPLPGYDKEGRKVILARWNQLDVSGSAYSFNDWFRAITLVFDALCFLDEKVMVNGVTFLMDAKGVAMKHLMFFGFNNCRKQFAVMQNGYPIRIKQVHYINNNRVIAFFLGVVKSVVTAKLANRIQLHGYQYDTVFDYIDQSSLPDEYLAADYSGERAGTSQEIMERFIRENILEPTKLDFLRRLYSANNISEDSDTASSEEDFDDAVAEDSDHFFEDAMNEEEAESFFEESVTQNTAAKEE
ncbi:alpha-tocopherol transfer protein-like isoform X2 [Mercenaria mercenaria]|uniref:alpha-tocopherol transfer protein-like isoform X2 n=1 Tax=Mercenaria mercenaria TaxID=6596 RepID=UPI001E1D3D79|nr:alpha-tocopherol transfer protein-like isoform X2 [Mercenaria mercenaria]